jgi:hypothetical protein
MSWILPLALAGLLLLAVAVVLIVLLRRPAPSELRSGTTSALSRP